MLIEQTFVNLSTDVVGYYHSVGHVKRKIGRNYQVLKFEIPARVTLGFGLLVIEDLSISRYRLYKQLIKIYSFNRSWLPDGRINTCYLLYLRLSLV